MKKLYNITVFGEHLQSTKVQVEGTPIKIETLEDIDFFYFKDSSGGYNVTEAKTGFMFCCANLKKEIPAAIERIFTMFGRERTRQIVLENIHQLPA